MNQQKIAVIGLGYVGLPLAVEFAKKYTVIGYDVDAVRVEELKNIVDRTQQINGAQLKDVLSKEKEPAESSLYLTARFEEIASANTFIVTVPTPVDEHKKPDLKPLLAATKELATVLKKGDLLIYESTVYPGCTEEECVPILEKHSGLKFNQDFFCGYSPERINPGDQINTLTKIKKVTSGSTPEIAIRVDKLYQSIIDAGTHLSLIHI